MRTLIAQITNPVIEDYPETLSNSGVTGAVVLEKYIAIGIQTAITLGALAVLVYFFIGALRWITSTGDKGQVERARAQIINAIIGLAILVSIVAILDFVGPAFFGIDILDLNFINQIESDDLIPSTGDFMIGPNFSGWR